MYDPVDTIVLDYDTGITSIMVTEVIPQIQVIEVDTTPVEVTSVNGLNGAVKLTHVETLTYSAPVSGIYSYSISHGLNHLSPMVVVYNDDNEEIIVDVSVTSVNVVTVSSRWEMTGFKVVIQI